jgi:glycosyltransferase involved in cell wall biosynthesis
MNKPKHVLMLSPDCYMIDRRILQEARSLTQAGYRVTLLSGFETPKEEHYSQDGIEIHRYKYSWDDERIKKIRSKIKNERLRLWFHKIAMAVINRFFHLKSFDLFIIHKARQFHADVIHVHDLPMLKHGAYLAKKWKVPLVYDAHEVYHEEKTLTPQLRRKLLRLEKRYVPQTSLFITVNKGIADFFQKLHNKRPIVLMNCADRFKNFDRKICRKQLVEKADISTEAQIILYQGWFSAERNLETLIKAFAQLPPNVYFCIIGYGDYEKHLKTLVTENKLDDKVRFLGRIEPEDILTLTAGADIGVIPYLPVDINHKFCSPNKLFEYVQANVPIVTHQLPFMEWMEQKYGILTTGDFSSVDSSTKTLLSIIKNQETLEKMRINCMQAAESLNWETESLKLLEAYKKLF